MEAYTAGRRQSMRFKRPTFFQKDDSHEFKPTMVEIEERPIHPLGKYVFWIVIAAMVFFGFWLYFGKVDIVISARGLVIPEGDVKILQPLDTGVVSSILCKEGDFVKKGQALMEIDPSFTAPELAAKQKTLQLLEIEQERLIAVLGKKPFSPYSQKYDHTSIGTQREIYFSTMAGLKNQIEAKRAAMRKIDEEMKAVVNEKIHNESLLTIAVEKERRLVAALDIIARSDYEKAVTDIASHQNAIAQSESKLRQLNQQKRQISEELCYLEENFKTTTLKEYADKQKQGTEILSEIDKTAFRNEKQKILAPADGHISNLLFHTVGGVVTPAQKLITLVPRTAPLTVKVMVLNKDIGFIRGKMPAAIKVDTFDFQKYGLLKGEVRNIARHSTEDDKLGPVYEVFITPLENTLMVDGVRMPITSGMSLTAEIKVGKRRIIEFFVYPLIKYLDEGVKVR
jgi:hemolysin D